MGFLAQLNKLLSSYVSDFEDLTKQTQANTKKPRHHIDIDLMLPLRERAPRNVTGVEETKFWGLESLTALYNQRQENAKADAKSSPALLKTVDSMVDSLDSQEFHAALKPADYAHLFLQQKTIDHWIAFRKEVPTNTDAHRQWKQLFFSPGDRYVDECAVRLQKWMAATKTKGAINHEPMGAHMWMPYLWTEYRFTTLKEYAATLKVPLDRMQIIFPVDTLRSDNPFWNSRIPGVNTGFQLVDFILEHVIAHIGDLAPSTPGEPINQFILTFDKAFFKSPLKNAWKPRDRFPISREELEDADQQRWLRDFYAAAEAEEDSKEFHAFLAKPIHNLIRILDTRFLAPVLYQFLSRAVQYLLNHPQYAAQRERLNGIRLIIDGANGYGIPNQQLIDQTEEWLAPPMEPLVLDISAERIVKNTDESQRLSNSLCEGDHQEGFYLRKCLPIGGRATVVSKDTDMLYYLCMYQLLYGQKRGHQITLLAGDKMAWDIESLITAIQRKHPTLNVPSVFAYLMLSGTDPTPPSLPYGVTLENFLNELKSKERPPKNICDVTFEPTDSKTLDDSSVNFLSVPMRTACISMNGTHFDEFCRVYEASMKRKFPKLQAKGVRGPWSYYVGKESKTNGYKPEQERVMYVQYLDDAKKTPITKAVLQSIFRRLRYNLLLSFAFLDMYDLRTLGLQKSGTDGKTIYGFSRHPVTRKVMAVSEVTGGHLSIVLTPM